jgi:hypothetical protein
LGNQHSVEWIIVMPGQVTRREPVRDADRQRGEPALTDLPLKVIRGRELAQGLLNRDLPGARSRHHDQILGVSNGVACLIRQTLIRQHALCRSPSWGQGHRAGDC